MDVGDDVLELGEREAAVDEDQPDQVSNGDSLRGSTNDTLRRIGQANGSRSSLVATVAAPTGVTSFLRTASSHAQIAVSRSLHRSRSSNVRRTVVTRIPATVVTSDSAKDSGVAVTAGGFPMVLGAGVFEGPSRTTSIPY